MLSLLFIAVFAVLNRARGSRLFGLTDSTEIGRIVSMFLMALVTSLYAALNTEVILYVVLFVFAGLLLWASPAWDSLWSAEIGNDPNHSKLWGLARMTIRQMLILPTLIGFAFLVQHTSNLPWTFLVLTYALPYLVFGAIDKETAIPRSEYTIGALIGLTIYKIMI